MNKTLIKLNGVSKSYSSGPAPVTVLHSLDLEVHEGDFICIAGPSGSGKTTLINLMGCMDSPTTGSISINGVSTNSLNRSQAASMRLQNIGFIFQSFNLIPVLTAYENVEYVLMMKKVPAPERDAQVKKAMEGVGLTDHMRKRPAELSGGQQQRVAVARAIVGSPPLVLADEPTANLDSKTGMELINMLKRLNIERRTAFVFSSHDPRIISSADRVISLQDGRIVTA